MLKAFYRAHKRGLVVLGALLLILAITGGLYAYTYLTNVAQLTVDGKSTDFAEVTSDPDAVNVTWNLFGRYLGAIPAGYQLFAITPSVDYNGDLDVTVYLSNPDELTKNYLFWNMRLQLVKLVGGVYTPVDKQGITQLLTMDNGKVNFYLSGFTPGTTYYVLCKGGSFLGSPWIAPGYVTYSPLLFCEVRQAGP